MGLLGLAKQAPCNNLDDRQHTTKATAAAGTRNVDVRGNRLGLTVGTHDWRLLLLCRRSVILDFATITFGSCHGSSTRALDATVLDQVASKLVHRHCQAHHHQGTARHSRFLRLDIVTLHSGTNCGCRRATGTRVRGGFGLACNPFARLLVQLVRHGFTVVGRTLNFVGPDLGIGTLALHHPGIVAKVLMRIRVIVLSMHGIKVVGRQLSQPFFLTSQSATLPPDRALDLD
ncbi:hypothetical protein BCR44DRAFT_1439182 [Catenaria anguillulae PL171]|uniref:Uncharacterized protein n=1 Tax=Catenaria anguillulae PL171 TaxID=765915 RepID=A0A1Y2HEG8_9FUNG|nr:hypothetical protein BCR44DRAFT_1439182 [Catenaria anguillulae PL171]